MIISFSINFIETAIDSANVLSLLSFKAYRIETLRQHLPFIVNIQIQFHLIEKPTTINVNEDCSIKHVEHRFQVILHDQVPLQQQKRGI